MFATQDEKLDAVQYFGKNSNVEGTLEGNYSIELIGGSPSGDYLAQNHTIYVIM